VKTGVGVAVVDIRLAVFTRVPWFATTVVRSETGLAGRSVLARIVVAQVLLALATKALVAHGTITVKSVDAIDAPSAVHAG